jgi:6-phosphogluconolactonase (cycloisomerase 2 family)
LTFYNNFGKIFVLKERKEEMKITIKHFTQTGSSTWVLTNENKELLYDANDNALFGYTRKDAEALALRIADDMNFTTIQTEYFYGGQRKYKTIK